MNKENLGFVKVAACSPLISKANTTKNTNLIIEAINVASKKGAGIIAFPSLAITGSGCGDLYAQTHLYKSQLLGIQKIAEETKGTDTAVILGIYLKSLNRLKKATAYIAKGEIILVPDNSLSKEELQFFDSSSDFPLSGNDILADMYQGNVIFSDNQELITVGLRDNIPALLSFQLSNDTARIGQFAYLKNLLSVNSSKNHCGQVHIGEDGSVLIAENGEILVAQSSFANEGQVLFADIDYEALAFDRTSLAIDLNEFYTAPIPAILEVTAKTFDKTIRNNPFEPKTPEGVISNCYEIFEIQSHALAKRLAHTHSRKSVLGISGGLDSTLALLVTINAHRILGKPASDVIAVTMPGFGTTGQTYTNAMNMMKATGAEVREISIVDSVTQHFKDINHDINNQDLTYENSQARERTQILMDIANSEGGLVIGTGDLSEGALGWCTYNGDHMSMYGVNSALPKTVIKLIVKWFIEYRLTEDKDFCNDNALLGETLTGVLNTPISPELLPPDEDGNIAQITEDNVGPYILHDFFIYHTLRFGIRPEKLQFIAGKAFEGEYTEEFISKWLKVFYKRFFAQQFKRNCAPDSPVIGSIDLGNKKFVMPSDIDSEIWLQKIK